LGRPDVYQNILLVLGVCAVVRTPALGIGPRSRSTILRATMAFILATMLAACVFGVVASVVISRASNKSPLWNIWFAVSLVVAGAAVLALLVSYIIRRILG
jgi:hypothetical protein